MARYHYEYLENEYGENCQWCANSTFLRYECKRVRCGLDGHNYANGFHCRKWEKHPTRTANDILSYQLYFYILSAICQILDIDMNNRIYQEIKSLIELVREDETTTKEAIGYDSFGPELANKLRYDEKRVNISQYLLENYLIKIYSLIGLNQQEKAIEIYKDMVMYLYMRYRNMDNYAELIDAKQFENPKILLK